MRHQAANEAEQSRERERFDRSDRFVVVDGMRMHYVCAGAGRPILLIHGLVGCTRNWVRNIDVLAESAQVYALDLPNMGSSSRISGLDAGLVSMADRVAAWMNAVGLHAADVAGHSHGGAIAMMLAARHPERVRSLILFAPANPYSRSSDWLLWFYRSLPGRQLARFAPFVPQFIQKIALGRMYGDPSRITAGCLAGYVDGLRVPGTVDHVLEIVRRWHNDMRLLKAALPSLAEIPVMLVWGDRDRAVSYESGRRLHEELPESEWCVVSGAGHVAFEEMPDTCNDLMLRWLKQTEGSRYPGNSAAKSRNVQNEPRGSIQGLQQASGQA